jgi:hypothetical protein
LPIQDLQARKPLNDLLRVIGQICDWIADEVELLESAKFMPPLRQAGKVLQAVVAQVEAAQTREISGQIKNLLHVDDSIVGQADRLDCSFLRILSVEAHRYQTEKGFECLLGEGLCLEGLEIDHGRIGAEGGKIEEELVEIVPTGEHSQHLGLDVGRI